MNLRIHHLLAPIALLLSCTGTHANALEKPNVILIMTDDQGYGDLGCTGNPVLKTPQLDILHEQSVRFTDFHVAPRCTPTRGSLMTGLDPMRNGATHVCQGRSMVRGDLKMMPEYFAESGYATGLFGKWHLGDSYPHRPRFRGFQEVLSFRAWGITSLADFWQNDYFDPVLMHNGTGERFEGYCTDIFFQQAVDWIRQCQQKNVPFFAYIATNTPHAPNIVAEKDSAPYVGEYRGTRMPDAYYGMIANIDRNIGRLEEFLEAERLSDNTILVFLSDNGTRSQEAMEIYNAGMRDRKGSVFEGGHRVPLFIRWVNGNLRHGQDIAELAVVQDLLPTLVDLCGLNANVSNLDGVSLAPLLRGTESQLEDRICVIQIGAQCNPWEEAVVLWDAWRLIDRDQLFHVDRDPDLQTNVASDYPEIVNRMASYYDAWYAEANARFEQPRWITVGSRQANPMVLYAQDWSGDYCDNRKNLAQGTAQGHWNVMVARPGVYELELRRWPRESQKTLTEGVDGPEDKGKSSRPIAAANIRIAGNNYTLSVSNHNTHATFRIKLRAGKTQLATTLVDRRNRALCSAMYVYLRLLPADEAARATLTASQP